MFVEKVESDKGQLIWANVNSKDFLPAFIQAFADSALLIQETLQLFWLVQKGEMYLTDAKRVVQTSLAGFGLVTEIMKSVIGIITEISDTSFYTLFISPQSGGFSTFIDTFKYHLFDATDPDRPYDEGNAVLLPVVYLISMADMAVADQAFDNLENLFNKAGNEGKAFMKELTENSGELKGMEDTADPNGFWKHYYTKRIIGSRKKLIDYEGWNKMSIMDLLPSDAVAMLQALSDSWTQVADGVPDSSSLIAKTEAMYDSIFASIKEVVRIIDAYTRLFLDNQITLLQLPAIEGEALKAGNSIYELNKDLFDMLNPPNFDYSGKKPAVQVLSEFMAGLPSLLKEHAYKVEQDPLDSVTLGMSEAEQEDLYGEVQVENPFHKSDIHPNFTNFLRNDYYVGGMVCMFKSGSLKLVEEQAASFLRLFGVSL